MTLTTTSHYANLLATRICDLPLGGPSPLLAGQVAGLYADLQRAGLRHFRPRVYWGDEWFSPDGLPVIAAPFYLADERLLGLERARTGRAPEGGTPASCRMLLRHEAGHGFDHAFAIGERRDFRRVFGDASRAYDPDAFVPDRRSRDFVRHLPGFYAQAHPDEDFAETFATLLAPARARREAARAGPTLLKKLRFVGEMVEKFGARKPLVADDGSTDYAAWRMRSTLARYYERRGAAAAGAARRRRQAFDGALRAGPG